MRQSEDLKSTLREIKEFLISPIWRDIKELMEGKLEVTTNALINESEERNMFRLQGSISEIKLLLSLPESMKEELQEEKEDE